MTDLAQAVVQQFLAQGKTLATAESCTGGLLGAMLTEIPGSSAVYLGGIISYTCPVKEKLVGVPGHLLEQYGAVSEQVAIAMAQGAKQAVGTDVGVGITGLAGPDGDGSGKPVGLVYVAISTGRETMCRELHLPGGRADVRRGACQNALEQLLELA